MSDRCGFTWFSQMRGAMVRCWHLKHDGHARHQAWSNRKERRKWEDACAWVTVGMEQHVTSGRWVND